MPPELKIIGDCFAVIEDGKIPELSGVYFLCHGDKLNYIGQSSNLKRRIRQQVSSPRAPFECCYIILSERMYKFLETLFIHAFDPEFNSRNGTLKSILKYKSNIQQIADIAEEQDGINLSKFIQQYF